jgi:hypothetical protein
MLPSKEQRPIIQAVFDRVPVVEVKASAGTGKTTTIRLIKANEPDLSMLYVCFTKAIQVEAARTMPDVLCLTQYALAYRMLRIDKTYRRERIGKPIMPGAIMRRYGLKTLHEALAAKQALENYCMSADRWIDRQHVPREATLSLPEAFRDDFASAVVNITRRLWLAVVDPKEAEFGLPHTVYMKVWQAFEGAPLPRSFDVVAGDEVQDFNPAQADAMSRHDACQLWIGDPNQEIFKWRGACKAMSSIKASAVFNLTESRRFGPEIAGVANKVLALGSEKTPPLVGIGQPGTLLKNADPERPFTWLFRTNMQLLLEVVGAIDKGYRVHVIGGLTEACNLLESVWYAYCGQYDRIMHPMIRLLGQWSALIEASEYQHELRLAITQVKKLGTGILSIVNKVREAGEVPEQYADLVFSTIHKSKGLEWDRVKVASDFEDLVYYRPKIGDYKTDEDVMHLAYVAATRAKQTLAFGEPFTYLDDLNVMVAKSRESRTAA